MARLVSPVVETSSEGVYEISLPPFYYGEYGIFGLKSFKRIVKLPKKALRVTKKVTTSTPFKVAAGAALAAAVAPGVVGVVRKKGISIPSGLINMGKTGDITKIGQTVLDTAIQLKLAQQQMKLAELQALSQPASQPDSVFYQQALAQNVSAQEAMSVLQSGEVVGSPSVSVPQQNDFTKYALVGGGVALLLLFLLNR